MGRGVTRILLVATMLALQEASFGADAIDLTGAFTVIGQTCDDRDVDDSATGSLDVYLKWTRGRGALDIYLESNTSLKDDGVATLIPESNGDAGSALDEDRDGRAQISEVKYTYTWSSGRRMAAGLLDPSAYLDSTRINNDENMQFLGAAFVNNPAIEFPDYAMGVFSQLSSDASSRKWNAVLASSHGIADNPNLSYSQVLNVTEGKKGAFAASEIAWPLQRTLVRTGAWLNTSSHLTLRGDDEDARNYGAYSVIGVSRGRVAANMRIGMANPHVSLAAGFASVGFQWDHGRVVLGAAAAQTWLSSRAPQEKADDTVQLETYARVALAENLYVTPSIQYLANSALDASGATVDDEVLVFSLRLHYSFPIVD